MKKKVLIYGIILIVIVLGLVSAKNCIECSFWVNSKTCWVVESPETGKIIGIILYKASIVADDVNSEWLKLIFAPVRNIDTGELFNGAGYFIRKDNTTIIPPERW